MSSLGVVTPGIQAAAEVHSATRAEYSDAEIAQRVRTFLQSRHFPGFRNLQVDVNNGLVSLSGHVRSFYEKQVALNTCQRVAGVLSLIDHVRVDLETDAATTRRGEAKPR